MVARLKVLENLSLLQKLNSFDPIWSALSLLLTNLIMFILVWYLSKLVHMNTQNHAYNSEYLNITFGM